MSTRGAAESRDSKGREAETPRATPPEVSAQQATGLLKMGMARAARPVDGVIVRLRRSDGAAWAERRVEEALRSSLGARVCAADALVGGGLGLEALQAVKGWCKQTVARSPEESDASLGALLTYFLVIASGAATHGVRLTERSIGEVSEALVDLADVMPSDWSALARRGAERLAE